jgi:alpha-amylase
MHADRRIEIGKPQAMTVWTGFDFPARQGKYSDFKLRHEHFNGIDWDDKQKQRGVYKFCDEQGNAKSWSEDVDPEFGNFDYLMFTNLYYDSVALRTEVMNWGIWIVRELGLSGFRLDAMKHMSRSFVLEFITRMQKEFGRDFFILGEYWKWDSEFLADIAKKMEGRCRLYDTHLCYNLSNYSVGKRKDLRRVLEGTLVEIDSEHAVVSRNPA